MVLNQQQIEHFMSEAMREGRKARDKCAPNPPIGCVLVNGGQIVSRGHTNEPGKPHAEAMALEALKPVPDGTAAFVTLEPCSFQGKTPSCAKALIQSGIKEVYVGIVDPHPLNQGQGIALLEQAGVTVVTGILSNDIADELGPHLIRSI